MSPTFLRYGALAALSFALACDSDPITAGEQADVVAAFRDVQTDFNAITTYALPDSVVHLTADPAAAVDITRELDPHILSRVRTHLDERGYVEEPAADSSRADVVVLVWVIGTPSFTAWADYPWFEWWGFYPGFGFGAFDPTWGVDYPWAGDAVVFEYDVGTLVIDMIDTRSIDEPAQQVRAVWSGAVNGILGVDARADEKRVMRGIDEAFALSPYLRRSP